MLVLLLKGTQNQIDPWGTWTKHPSQLYKFQASKRASSSCGVMLKAVMLSCTCATHTHIGTPPHVYLFTMNTNTHTQSYNDLKKNSKLIWDFSLDAVITVNE